MRKPTGGDTNRKCLNLHHGVVISDKFMETATMIGFFLLITLVLYANGNDLFRFFNG